MKYLNFQKYKMKKIFFLIISSLLAFNIVHADMKNSDKEKAWDCSGIYMANYFLPSGESFEYSMKEKSMASVKVLKTYALEIGIDEKEWDDGVNKGVDISTPLFTPSSHSFSSIPISKAYVFKTFTDAIDFSFILYSNDSPLGRK